MLKRGKRRCRTGVVIGDKSDKTRQVSVERTYCHPLYGRVLHSRTKVAVHDEKNISCIGDKVTIMESRPLSRTKRWVLVKVVSKVSSV